MAGTTPKYAFPYPSGTDPLKQGDDTIKALAERQEAVLGDGLLAAVTFAPVINNVATSARAGRYIKVGKLVWVSIHFTLTGAPTGNLTVGFPVTPRDVGMGQYVASGTVGATRQGVGYYFGHVVMSSLTELSLMDPAGGPWRAGVPAAWASGDPMRVQYIYEAA